MRQVLLGIVTTFLVFLGGCGPVKPMTEADFKGFCYQYGQGKSGDCDTIEVCDPYSVVMNTPQPSLQKCLDECAAIHGPQVWKYVDTGCSGPADAARDWCQRYCRTVYPK
jgi:hypothetical protein